MTRRRLEDWKIDKNAAHHRVERSRLPAKNYLCMDCGLQASEWDHYLGYGRNWDKVESVCVSCHQKREFARGKYPQYRKVQNIGPLTKEGRFLSPLAKEIKRLEGVSSKALISFLKQFEGPRMENGKFYSDQRA